MRIVNDVKWNLGRDAYAAASARFVELCGACGIGGDRAGFFGSAGFPGVSDLDALAVGDCASLVRLAMLHGKEAEVSADYRYLFWHEPLWILDEVADDAYRLHTMEGARCAYGAGSLVKGVVAEETRRVLHVAWLIFLIGAVAEIARQRDETGLRLLLLVHKNLRHSIEVFAGKDGAGMTADELREWAKQCCRRGEEAEAGRIVWDQVQGALATACEGMDAVCERAVTNTRAGSRWILTRRSVFERGEDTSSGVGDGRIRLNPYAFEIAKGYLHGSSNTPEIAIFVAAAERCRSAYKRAGLTYPFLEPITIAQSGWKKGVTLGVNRLADTLCSVF